MKLGVFALVGIFAAVVVQLLFQFYHKIRKRDGEVREQTAYPMHHDARITTIELQPISKMNSGVPAPLLPSNKVTNELGVSVSSSNTQSLDMSEHRYSDIHLTDTMKKEMLQDPLVTAESKEKVEKELAENEKLLNNSARASGSTVKMNSGVPRPLLPLNEVTNELGVSVSPSCAHSLDTSEHRYSDFQLTDTVKRKMLQDPFVAPESKEKIKKELAENEKLLENSERVSVAQNEEEMKLLAEIQKLHERK